MPALVEQETFYHIVANIALTKVWQNNPDTKSLVNVQTNPRRRLLATTNIGVGKLWSHGHCVKHVDINGDMHIEICTDPPNYYSISSPSGQGKKFDVMWWRVAQETREEQFANVKLRKVCETIRWPIDIGLNKDVEVKVPIASNYKHIKKDTEVKLSAIKKRTSTTRLTMSFIGEDMPSSSKAAKHI